MRCLLEFTKEWLPLAGFLLTLIVGFCTVYFTKKSTTSSSLNDLNVSFTMPEYDGEDSVEWFTIKQVKDGEIIDDCEREFRLWYCEEED